MSVKVAVAGNGYWGKNLIRNFAELGSLGMICDPSPIAEANAREKYPSIAYTRDYSEVLADDSITAVVIAAPAARHFAMALEALQKGKDVFVEKPLALSVEQGMELVDLSARLNRILMVGHILQYHPAVVKLKELIQSGALGRIQYLYSNRLNIGKIRTEENILWSFAPHDISVILGLLNEEPSAVSCTGGTYLSDGVADVTMSDLTFPSGVHANIFVSWLHPFKEQRLVVVGSQKMAVFDDTAPDKLVLYAHKVEWKDRVPNAVKASGEPVVLDKLEPLRSECTTFLEAVATRRLPLTDGQEGLRVLRVLSACQSSLETGKAVAVSAAPSKPYFAHSTAFVDEPCDIGRGTKIWHYSHVMKGARIGDSCIFGQNCNVADNVVIGSNVKVQNNVSIYSGTIIEDDVFLGPSCVLTNVTNPRSQINRHSLYENTVIRRGASIGANATILCGVELGRYCFVGAGAVVTKDVLDYALVIGNPGHQVGWMSRHGQRLESPDSDGIMVCPESGFHYKETALGELRCLDLDESAPLPAALSSGSMTYHDFKNRCQLANGD